MVLVNLCETQLNSFRLKQQKQKKYEFINSQVSNLEFNTVKGKNTENSLFKIFKVSIETVNRNDCVIYKWVVIVDCHLMVSFH